MHLKLYYDKTKKINKNMYTCVWCVGGRMWSGDDNDIDNRKNLTIVIVWWFDLIIYYLKEMHSRKEGGQDIEEEKIRFLHCALVLL